MGWEHAHRWSAASWPPFREVSPVFQWSCLGSRIHKSIKLETILQNERNGFQARVSMRKRDDFKGDVYGIGFNTEQVNILGETIIDAQIGFDFGEAGYKNLEGLSIFLQDYNLTEEPFTSLQGDSDLQVRDYQDYGKSYLLGFSYKM